MENTFNQQPEKEFWIQVDEHKKWTPCKYRKVNEAELDMLLDHYGAMILRIVSNGQEGAMAMWACFKNCISGGCYSEMINAYRLLSGDSKSLVDREHELRHLWNQYEELWRIRYHGSVENYHIKRAADARAHFLKYCQKEGN